MSLCALILALLNSSCALAYHRFSFIWSLISACVACRYVSNLRSGEAFIQKTLNRQQLSFRRSVARERFLSTVTYSLMSFERSPRYSHSPSFLIFMCIPCFTCLFDISLLPNLLHSPLAILPLPSCIARAVLLHKPPCFYFFCPVTPFRSARWHPVLFPSITVNLLYSHRVPTT